MNELSCRKMTKKLYVYFLWCIAFQIPKFQMQPLQQFRTGNELTNEIVGNTTDGDFVPQFMLDLYNVVADEHGGSRRGAPDLGKTINCIFAEDSTMKSSPGKFFYRFNLSSVKKHEDLKRVELRVFKTKTKDLRQKGKRFFRTDVSFITDTFEETRATMVSSTGYGWLPFDVTRIAKRYFKHKDSFLNIEIAVKPIRDQLPTFRFLTSTNTSTRALLILYSDTKLDLNIADLQYGKSPLEAALTKSTTARPPVLQTKMDFFTFLLERQQQQQKYSERSERSRRDLGSRFNSLRPCRRKSLTINFEHHKEFRDVIAPKKINIYRCAGSCMVHNPINSGIVETNHARLQKLAYWYNVMQNPKPSLHNKIPCCAPKALGGLTLLFKSPMSANIYMTTLEKAIVSECWCS